MLVSQIQPNFTELPITVRSKAPTAFWLISVMALRAALELVCDTGQTRGVLEPRVVTCHVLLAQNYREMFCGSFSLLLLTCRFTSVLVKEEEDGFRKQQVQ